VASDLTKRITQWSKTNGDEAHAEALQEQLARGARLEKRKVQCTNK